MFLLDTCPVPTDRLHGALCLLCTRLLLFLSRFPDEEHAARVGWNYTLFNSGRPEGSVRAKTSQFHECRSELLEKLFGDTKKSLAASAQAGPAHAARLPCPPVKQVYKALAAAVQDFIWDAPDISSPVRPIRGRTMRSRRMMRSTAKLEPSCRNVIFICSCSPQSGEELGGFCGESGGSTVDTFERLCSELLPSALLSQLKERRIAVHWVDLASLRDESTPRVRSCVHTHYRRF